MAATLDQLDLALDHLSKGSANDARFALMLTDNLVEITLHRFAEHALAEHKSSYRHRREGIEPEPLLIEAVGRFFEPKVKFAKASGKLTEEAAASVKALHDFRNDVYHVGLQHEPILPALSAFYYGIACDLLAELTPSSWGYSPGMQLPERAAKYFKSSKGHFSDAPENYRNACVKLKSASTEYAPDLAASLADHMDEVIAETDRLIDFLATDSPQRQSRDEVIIACQAWPFAFTEEGKRYAREHGCPARYVGEYVDWLSKNYKWKCAADPIQSWQSRAQRVGRAGNPHNALAAYRDFMNQTTDIRSAIYESAAQLDAHIDLEIERARGN